MKQYITQQQLDDFRIENNVGHYKLKDIMFHGDTPMDMYLKLNIGKLIEILEELNFDRLCAELERHSQAVYYRKNCIENKYIDVNQEFCDVLWIAVKEVI